MLNVPHNVMNRSIECVHVGHVMHLHGSEQRVSSFLKVNSVLNLHVMNM
jgi:hypothetical protein